MIGTTISDRLNPLGVPTAQLLATPGVQVLASVDEAHAAGLQITQGNEKPPAWQGDATTGRMAPDVPGGMHYEKVVLISTGQPLPLSDGQKDLE